VIMGVRIYAHGSHDRARLDEYLAVVDGQRSGPQFIR
jgi:hypothetical protein